MWATLWLSGAVAMTIGHPTLTPIGCEEMLVVMQADISSGTVFLGEWWVVAPNDDLLPWQPWELSCEEVQLVIGTEKNEND